LTRGGQFFISLGGQFLISPDKQERNDKLRPVETQVSEGNTLKNAIQSAGISEQTHYHSKGAARNSAQKDD